MGRTLKNDLGATVLPGLTAATDGMRALFDELKHDPELIGIGAASLGALYGRRKLMAAAGGGGGSMALNRAAGQIEGAAVEQVKARRDLRRGRSRVPARRPGDGGRGALAGRPGTPCKESREATPQKSRRRLPRRCGAAACRARRGSGCGWGRRMCRHADE